MLAVGEDKAGLLNGEDITVSNLEMLTNQHQLLRRQFTFLCSSATFINRKVFTTSLCYIRHPQFFTRSLPLPNCPSIFEVERTSIALNADDVR